MERGFKFGLIYFYLLNYPFKGHKTDVGEADGLAINITDFVAGDAVAFTDDGIDHVMEAIEMGTDYQGDIVLTADQLEQLEGRAATTNANGKWPKSGQVVSIPYVISSSFSKIRDSEGYSGI